MLEIDPKRLSKDALNRISKSVLDGMVGTTRVHLADGTQGEFQMLEMQKFLPWICKTSENYRLAMRDMVETSGACQASHFCLPQYVAVLTLR